MRIRTDILDVYIFRRGPAVVRPEFLQLLRAPDRTSLPATWQPVMGHIEPDETARSAALRELREEVGLRPDDPLWLGFYALQSVHPFFVAAREEIHLSPRFAAEMSPEWRPRLNSEHTDFRWVSSAQIETHFMWPGQKACCQEILRELVNPDALGRDRLRLPLDTPDQS